MYLRGIGYFLWNIVVYLTEMFYGTQGFITMFTITRPWTLSWTSCIQFTQSNPIYLKVHFNIILHLSLYVFLSGLPTKLYAFLITPTRVVRPAHLIIL
jgi:hypothetical protein